MDKNKNVWGVARNEGKARWKQSYQHNIYDAFI
jgi:hypothetical protein